MGDEKIYEAVKGAKIASVTKTSNEDVRLALDDGRALRLWLDGDCCSSSYYTDTTQFDELIGATIQSVEERDGESHAGLDAEAAKTDKDRDAVSWHFLVFATDKGHVTIDWRNDSNGYYDGDVHPEIQPA